MKKMINLFDHTFMPITIMYFYTKIMRELYTNFMIGLLSYFLVDNCFQIYYTTLRD